jgi:hypothetical protein
MLYLYPFQSRAEARARAEGICPLLDGGLRRLIDWDSGSELILIRDCVDTDRAFHSSRSRGRSTCSFASRVASISAGAHRAHVGSVRLLSAVSRAEAVRNTHLRASDLLVAPSFATGTDAATVSGLGSLATTSAS